MITCNLMGGLGNQIFQIFTTISYAIRTKVSIIKNHVNGLGYKDGKIIAVPQGYISDTKEALEQYKKQYSNYWNAILSGTGEILIDESESEIDE